MNREDRIRIYGSPIFPFEPTIGINGVWHFSPEPNTVYGKYIPFNHFIIHNDSTSTIKVEFRDTSMFIYAGQSREEENISFDILKITELSGIAITAGMLKIEISCSPMNADRKALEDSTNNVFDNLRKSFSMSGGI